MILLNIYQLEILMPFKSNSFVPLV